MPARNGVIFVALAVTWGSAFLWIAIAVDAGTSPWVVACGRLVLGAATVAAWIRLASADMRAQHSLQRLRPWWRQMVVMGLLMGAIPFTFLAYGQQSVTSGVAAILMATIPLWTVLIAFTGVRGTQDERVGPAALIGLFVGFVGVAVLLGGDIGPDNSLAGVGLIGVTTVAYAMGGLYAREQSKRSIPPLAGPLGVGLMGGLICLPGAVIGAAAGGTPDLAALGAILALGIGCTGLAYVAFFALIRVWGAARVSTVTYLIPVVGLALGATFRAEDIGIAQAGALVLILLGVLIANGRVRLPGLGAADCEDVTKEAEPGLAEAGRDRTDREVARR